MPIPDFQSWLLPLLEELADGQDHAISDLSQVLADKLGLTEEDKAVKLSSGKQFVYKNRSGWARTYLNKAGLIESPRRGIWKISDRGREVLATKPESLRVKDLKQFDEFREFHTAKPKADNDKDEPDDPGDKTPEEAFEAAYRNIKRDITDQLLEMVKKGTPTFFEELVVKLLLAMGYGGAVDDAGQVVGKSGDGGIDGVIAEDPLGLDSIYIQAKRWESTVGRPVVQSFAGSLDGVRAKKGVMITTSNFSADAKEYVSQIEKKIVLIDGKQLAELMFDYGLGVSAVETYQIKKIDQDFFEEE